MPRHQERACLEDGLKLDINQLARQGTIRRGGSRTDFIRWNSNYWGEVPRATIHSDLTGPRFGSIDIRLSGQDQHIALQGQPRRYGGLQWYFICPKVNRLVSVLWRPPGISYFASRQSFGPRVAYRSQFLDRDNRAHLAQSKINNRLCELSGENPEGWDMPPKPKWMRWTTYNRIEAKRDYYDQVLDMGFIELAKRFGKG